MAGTATRRGMIARMAGIAAGVGAFGAASRVRAEAGKALAVGEVNDGEGKATKLLSNPDEPTMVLESGQVGIGGRGTALRVRGHLDVRDGTISMITRRREGMYVQARENAITAVTSFRFAKESTITAYHRGGGAAIEGRSETRKWYGAGVYSFGQFVVQPGAGIATVPLGETEVDVSFDKNMTLGEESIVLATPQAGAEVAVKRAHFIDEKTLRITLVAPAPARTKIGYLVVKWS